MGASFDAGEVFFNVLGNLLPAPPPLSRCLSELIVLSAPTAQFEEA